MAEDIMEHVPCNLCGSNEYVVVYKGKLKEEEGVKASDVYKSSGSRPSEDTIVRCNSCSLVYVNPRLKAEEIIEGYSEGSDETFVSQVRGREAAFESGLRWIEKFSKPGKILDVGTAGGSFLAVAKRRGWQVHGLEPNSWLCDWAKKHYGLHVEAGTIDDAKFPENYFDVITLWDVIEHVPDPSAVLKKCFKLLKTGGLIYLNYPDYGSYASRIMKSRWIFLLSVHIYYFTRSTIARMLEKAGFQALDYRTHWQTLTLGYLVFRMKPYSRLLYTLGNIFTKVFFIQNLPIKYWLGQSGVIARKK